VRRSFLAFVLLLAACRARNPLALADAARLERDFNRDAAQSRVLLLISPT
jgi:hypothetical protein